MRKEILFGGTGGQGIQLMGRVLARALFLESFEAASKSYYDPGTMGGRSFCEVVIKEYPDDWPEIMAVDIFVVMSQEIYSNPLKEIKKDALVFYDPDLVTCKTGEKAYPIYATKIAEKLRNPRIINMAMLGGVVRITELVFLDTVFQALKAERKFSELNRIALEEGYYKNINYDNNDY